MEPTTQPTTQTVPPATPQTNSAPAQMQAVVDYMPNVSIVGAKSVMLEWTADNRLRLYEMDFDTKQATGIMFDVAVSEVSKVTGSVNMLTLHIGDKHYRLLFAAMRSAGLGGVGAAVAFNELKASGAKMWIDKLKANGVKIQIFGWAKTWILAIGIVLVVFAIVLISQLANGSF